MRNPFPIVFCLLSLVGCQGFHPVPAWNRSGEFYSLTRDYSTHRTEFGEDFCGLGKALVQGGYSGGQIAMVAIPLPTLYLGIPLMYAEQYTLCPIIDTLMLPRDLYIRNALRSEEEKGVVLELQDHWGRPATNILVGLRALRKSENSKGLVHCGQRKKSVNLVQRTDENGRCKFPIAASTCGRIEYLVSAWTREGRYTVRSQYKSENPAHQLYRLVPDKGCNPQDPEAPFLPFPTNIIPVLDSAVTPLVHFNSTTIDNRILDLYYGATPGASRPDDFDSYWEGERARLNTEVPFRVEIKQVGQDTEKALDIYSVSFPTFGRTICGFLARPGDNSGNYPVRIRLPDYREEFTLQNLITQSNEVTLALNVLPPKGTPDGDRLRKQFYPAEGINRSREAYFYHPFVLGAARGISWLLDQAYADAERSTITGIGEGGGMGLWLMAFEPRIQRGEFVNPSHLNQSHKYSSWPSLLDSAHHERARFIEKARPHVPYFDTLNFASRISRPVALAIDDDGSCLDENTILLIKALPKSEESRLYYCPHMSKPDMLKLITTTKSPR